MSDSLPTHLSKSLKIVAGFATVEVRDTQGDLIDIDAVENAMYKFMSQSRSLHFEHSLPIGEILRWERKEKDGKPAIFIEAFLYDNEATKEIWQKIQNGEIHGFSIRGIAKNKMNGKITELELYEISLVFQPANQEAILVNAIEKSKKENFITVMKSKLQTTATATTPTPRITFVDVMKSKVKKINDYSQYETLLNDVWKRYTNLIDIIYDQDSNMFVAELDQISSDIQKFKQLIPEISTYADNLIDVINDVVNQVKSLTAENPDVQKKLMASLLKIVNGRFMEWFVNTRYVIDKIKRKINI